VDELIAWYSRILDAEEAAAQAVLADGEYAADWHEQPMGDSRLTRFIARHDPARVLRGVAARRAILALHRPEVATEGPEEGKNCCAAETSWEDQYVTSPPSTATAPDTGRSGRRDGRGSRA